MKREATYFVALFLVAMAVPLLAVSSAGLTGRAVGLSPVSPATSAALNGPEEMLKAGSGIAYTNPITAGIKPAPLLEKNKPTEQAVEKKLTDKEILQIIGCDQKAKTLECSPPGFDPFSVGEGVSVSIVTKPSRSPFQKWWDNVLNSALNKRYQVRTPTAVAGVRGWETSEQLLNALSIGEAEIRVSSKDKGSKMSYGDYLINIPPYSTFALVKEESKAKGSFLAGLFGKKPSTA